MSRLPTQTFGETSRSQHVRSHSTSTAQSPWSQHDIDAPSIPTGQTSPRTSQRQSWNAPVEPASTSVGQDSAEEDELSEELPPHLRGGRSPRSQRALLTKRKGIKEAAGAASSKRSKRAAAEVSSSAQAVEASYPTGARKRDPSPQVRPSATAASHTEESVAGSPSERLLSLNEIDTFLDLIYKHHPDPMTSANMRQSVDAVYRDWEQFCARRQVAVRLAKKPLMDEYGKIFNGVYGPDFQAKARSIAHELSQRAASDKDSERRDSGSRHSGARSMTDGDTDEDDEDEEDDGDKDTFDASRGTTGSDAGKPLAASTGSKKKADKAPATADTDEAGSSSKKSNIAQVGRNGLAVLPPGLFDILRTHLRDDILSSIMPSVRNDLTEQTRELFLQNQDLSGRMKEMEDRVRNQDLWIRHLLSRDTSDMATPPIGAPTNVTGMAAEADPASGFSAKPRPFVASSRDSASFGRPPRHGFLSSGSDAGVGNAASDYFGGAVPMSPRQSHHNETRSFPQQGMAGPQFVEGRAPPAVAGPPTGSRPYSGPVGAFEHARWEPEHRPRSFREPVPTDRRPSFVNEPPHRRPGSGPAEVLRLQRYPSEQHDPYQARYEPPGGQYTHQHRLSVGEPRRLSMFGGGPRGSASGPSQPPIGSAGPVGGMPDDFRRPGPPMSQRETAILPTEPAYDVRRRHPNHPEAYLGGADTVKLPLPPRSMAVGSPEQQIQKNKRGRPSKAEMAGNRGSEFGGSEASSSFSGGPYPPPAPSRPYLS